MCRKHCAYAWFRDTQHKLDKSPKLLCTDRSSCNLPAKCGVLNVACDHKELVQRLLFLFILNKKRELIKLCNTFRRSEWSWEKYEQPESNDTIRDRSVVGMNVIFVIVPREDCVVILLILYKKIAWKLNCFLTILWPSYVDASK